MKKTLMTLLCPLGFLLAANTADAGWDEAGAIFLTIYPGARATCMGGAFCGLADDALAAYYNPGGLAFQHSVDVSLNHSNWLTGLYPDMYYEYASAAIPLGRLFTIAPAFTYITTGETVATDEYGNEIARFRNFDLAAGINCGVGLSDMVGVGVGLKYVDSYLYPGWLVDRLSPGAKGYAASVAMDVGALLRLPLLVGRIGIGGAVQNLGPSLQYIEGGDRDSLPRCLRLGASYTLTLKDILGPEVRRFSFSPKWLSDWFFNHPCITLTGDVNASLVGISSLGDQFRDSWKSFGIEFAPLAVVAVRAGYFEDLQGCRIGLTWGAGLDLKFLRFNIGNDSNIYDFPTDNWRFELDLNIGTPFLPYLG